jgi:Zn-dependent protease with chaperone function
LTKDVMALGLFPVAVNVLVGELLVSGNQTFVIAFLVFVDVILLISFISAIFRRDQRYSRIRKSLTPLTEPAIVETAKTILAKFRIPRIDIYMTNSDSFRGPPALTVGISSPSLWFSDRILRELSPSEIGEIIGHELAHVVKKHRIKILLIGLLYTLTGLNLISLTASRILPLPGLFLIGGLLLTFAGYALVVPYVRREFEFKADETAARILGNPDELASALLRVEGILNPPSQGSVRRWRRWAASHPPMSERVSRLRHLSSRNSESNQLDRYGTRQVSFRDSNIGTRPIQQ